MTTKAILWIGAGALILGSLRCHYGENWGRGENYPPYFRQYEALRFSGGQEIFSPQEIATADNNWEILLACRSGRTREGLREQGIDHTESQLMLLKAMGFLDFAKQDGPDKLLTVLPILGSSEKEMLIKEARDLAIEIEPALRSEIEELKEILVKSGHDDRLFSILFSAVVDGLVWFSFIERGIVNTFALDPDRPLFDGVYWAYYPKRGFRCGTNIAMGGGAFMILNWSDGPSKKIQEVFHWRNLYSLRDEFLEHGKVADLGLRARLIPYEVVDEKGNFIVPVIAMDGEDAIFAVCRSLAAKIVEFMARRLDLDVLRNKFHFADKEKAFIVAYHEWMWEFMEHLVEQGVIQMPLAFSDPEKASPKDIGKLFFIMKGSLNPK